MKKFSKVLSALHTNAVKYANSKTMTNKTVELEPKHFIESLTNNIMSQILPMLKVDLRSEFDVKKFASKSEFTTLQKNFNHVSNVLPQLDLTLAQLNLKSNNFATQSYVESMLTN